MVREARSHFKILISNQPLTKIEVAIEQAN